MAMRDLVGAESCGVANPLANLANIAQSGGQGMADARAYGGGMKPGQHMGGGGMAEMMNNLRPAMGDPQVGMFEQAQMHPPPGMMGPDMMHQQVLVSFFFFFCLVLPFVPQPASLTLLRFTSRISGQTWEAGWQLSSQK